MRYSSNEVTIHTFCFGCGKYIDSETEEYYVFIGKTSTDNAPYCTKCHEQDIENIKELDPFITPLYQRNYIRMNKDE